MNLENFQKHSSLDFRHDKQALAFSYLFRVLGALVFGVLLISFIHWVHPYVPNTADTYFGIAITGVPTFISILLIVLNVAVVLSLHELIHATIYYLDQRVAPRIGWRGLSIFAAAPNALVSRNVMLVNALAPFTCISLLGLALIWLLPISFLPWVLIPTLVNAAASGGDFMTLGWVLKQPKNRVFHDEGDVMTVYQAKRQARVTLSRTNKRGLA